jgi:leucyl-tRNA synthetase
VIWTEAGVEGAHRFLQRVWRLVGDAAEVLSGAAPQTAKDGEAAAISRAAHKALKAVGEDFARLGFNKAVARIHELVNELAEPLRQAASRAPASAESGALREAVDILLALIAPMAPHFAEECNALIGGETLVAKSPWPTYDPDLVRDDFVTLPVQINGKKRAEFTIARDAGKETIEKTVLGLEAVQSALAGKQPRKIIIVPQRIVNVVV